MVRSKPTGDRFLKPGTYIISMDGLPEFEMLLLEDFIGTSSLKTARRFINKVKRFFEDRSIFSAGALPGLERIGTEAIDRRCELILHDGDRSSENPKGVLFSWELLIQAKDGSTYSLEEAKDPSLIFTEEELRAKCDEVFAARGQERDDDDF